MEILDTIKPEMDDETTMLRVKNGEVKELDVLFRRHSGALFGFFYGMSQDASQSEDLVQEVFWRQHLCSRDVQPFCRLRQFFFSLRRKQ